METKTLDPVVFDKAAEAIEENGWSAPFNSLMEYPAYLCHGVSRCFCVHTALMKSLEDNYGVRGHLAILDDYLYFVCDYLNVDRRTGSIWRLNDNQPDYETGKAWAIATLKGCAAKLRGE